MPESSSGSFEKNNNRDGNNYVNERIGTNIREIDVDNKTEGSDTKKQHIRFDTVMNRNSIWDFPTDKLVCS